MFGSLSSRTITFGFEKQKSGAKYRDRLKQAQLEFNIDKTEISTSVQTSYLFNNKLSHTNKKKLFGLFQMFTKVSGQFPYYMYSCMVGL